MALFFKTNVDRPAQAPPPLPTEAEAATETEAEAATETEAEAETETAAAAETEPPSEIANQSLRPTPNPFPHTTMVRSCCRPRGYMSSDGRNLRAIEREASHQATVHRGVYELPSPAVECGMSRSPPHKASTHNPSKRA